jgi:hydrogenase maturation protease
MKTAPWLIIGVGNPSRGDDALAPMLLDRLYAAGVPSDVELLTDFQLQVEHALDLEGRRGVLFVDATASAVVPWGQGAALAPIVPEAGAPPASHALSAPSVLHVAVRVNGQAPAAWQLAIEGVSFALGEGLSPQATTHLERALVLAQHWIQAQRGQRDQREGVNSIRT